MTPAQKTENVLGIVKEARRWYTREEFVGITNILWDAIDASERAALPEQQQAELLPDGGR